MLARGSDNAGVQEKGRRHPQHPRPGGLSAVQCVSSKSRRAGKKLMRKLSAAGLVVVTLALTLLFAHSRASGQAAKSADPIFGRWMMDQTKSVNNRRGDHATYPTQHMRILAP